MRRNFIFSPSAKSIELHNARPMVRLVSQVIDSLGAYEFIILLLNFVVTSILLGIESESIVVSERSQIKLILKVFRTISTLTPVLLPLFFPQILLKSLLHRVLF